VNILHVVPAFFPALRYGGPARSVYEIAKEQAKRGHNVTVFTSNLYIEGKVPSNTPVIVDGITVFYFDYSAFWKKLGAHFVVVPNMKTIASKMFEVNLFDIVHLHEFRNYFSPIISSLCKKHSIPFFVTPRGTMYSRSVGVLKKKLFDILFGQGILKNAKAITALADKEKSELHNLFSVPEEKIFVVPNGVNAGDFSNLPPKKLLREKLGLLPNKKIILFLSRINKMKGLDILVNAFSLLSGDSVLVIAGAPEGSEKNYLDSVKQLVAQQGLSEKIFFAGLLKGKEKLAAYSAADVFVLPSRYEPFGLVILEALASNCPVVATIGCGLGKQLAEENAAIVVESNAREMAEAINSILTNESKRKNLIKNGSNFVRKFSWSNTVDKLEEVYGMVSV
tara:strand:- start:1894 stop:3075 length:1182 start_codon:yes stop_codon:yes gene_type:complete